MEVIKEVRLMSLPNDLYVQFMTDVKAAIEKYTADALRISKCKTAFDTAFERLDEAYQMQRKNNLTADLKELDAKRDDDYRCLRLHSEADTYNPDPDKRAKAVKVWNRIDAYGNIARLGLRAESARLTDMGKELLKAPLSDYVTELGYMPILTALIEANDNYVEMSQLRSDSKKAQVLNATRDARLALDDTYRDVVTAVNAQVAYQSLVDEETSSSKPEYPEVQSADITLDVLKDFIHVINVLIDEYITTAKQTGSEKNPDDSTPTPESPDKEEEKEEEDDTTPETPENPDEGSGEETEEPDDRPVVQ